MQSSRKKPPFGIAQIGKAFRNEITPRNFIFRSREFEQMELEFFCPPDEAMEWFEHFREVRWQWHLDMGLDPAKLRWHEHGPDELRALLPAAYDIEFEFLFGWNEFEGIHDRRSRPEGALRALGEGSVLHQPGDQGALHAATSSRPRSASTAPCWRCCRNGYTEDEVGGEKRTLLRLAPAVAPIKAAVLPLSKKLAEPAERIAADLRKRFNTRGRRDGQHRQALPTPGRDRDTVLRHLRLRVRRRLGGHRAGPRHDRADARLAERPARLPDREDPRVVARARVPGAVAVALAVVLLACDSIQVYRVEGRVVSVDAAAQRVEIAGHSCLSS